MCLQRNKAPKAKYKANRDKNVPAYAKQFVHSYESHTIPLKVIQCHRVGWFCLELSYLRNYKIVRSQNL